ncbi:MAG TPA: GNAT family N-acetyltransferase [Enteractinococcus sp.]
MIAFVATAAHAALVGQLLWDFNTEFDSDTPDVAILTQRFRRLLAREDVLAVVSGSANDPTGLALVTYRPTPYCDGPLAYLEELYVRPALRDQGIGTHLFTAALDDARSRGCCEMHIGVDAIDVDARRFYERHGFSNLEPDTNTQLLLYLRQL